MNFEQYKLFLNLVDSEWSRAYTRQSLYIGLQLIVFGALMNVIGNKNVDKTILVYSVVFLLIFSIANFIIALRSLFLQKTIFSIMKEFENESELMLFSLYEKHTQPKWLKYINPISLPVIALLFPVGWSLLLYAL